MERKTLRKAPAKREVWAEQRSASAQRLSSLHLQSSPASRVPRSIHTVKICTVLLANWTYPTIGTEIKGLVPCRATRTNVKLQNTVTDTTAGVLF